MIRLIKIEGHKILYNSTFWVVLGLYIVLIAPIAFGFDNMLNPGSFGNENQQPSMADLMQPDYSVFNFPDVWHNMAYLGSWFKLLLAVLIVILVTNEYTYKTLRQNIIDGMSKCEIIAAKELVILGLSIMAVVLLVLLTLVLGKTQQGVSVFEGSSILGAYFFTLVLYLNFAYVISVWLKKSGFVLGILFLYTLVIENLISYKLPDYLAQWLPMNLIDRMIPNPVEKLLGHQVLSDFSIRNIGVCMLYIMLFIALNYWMLKKGHAVKQ